MIDARPKAPSALESSSTGVFILCIGRRYQGDTYALDPIKALCEPLADPGGSVVDASGGELSGLKGGRQTRDGASIARSQAEQPYLQLGRDPPNACCLGDVRSLLDFARRHGPKLTIRECYRTQGFPDDFGINQKKTAAYRQIGNSVPVPMIATVLHQILTQGLLRPRFPVQAGEINAW